MKFLSNLFKKDKEKFIIPKGVQDVIPIKRIWEDGIFLVGKNRYSKTFLFTDTNYIVASEEDKEAMFLDYMQMINSFETDLFVKISILNNKINSELIDNNIKIEFEKDRLDRFRQEYNKQIEIGAKSSNGIVQEKYLTITRVLNTFYHSKIKKALVMLYFFIKFSKKMLRKSFVSVIIFLEVYK